MMVMTTACYIVYVLAAQVTGTGPMLYVKDTGERLLVIIKASHLVGLNCPVD